jgi:hypothetical protein
VSTRYPTDRRPQQGDGSPSRHSKNNRQGPAQPGQTTELGAGPDVAPSDLCGDTGLRPLAVEEESLRPEAVSIETPDGYTVPAENSTVDPDDPEATAKARPWYRVVSEWRDWYESYENSHIEFEREDGKIGRTKLENSYQPGYGDRYYARLKDFERGVEREYENLTTVMLTFSASTLNANGNPRCPADHMREVAEGWATARKQLYNPYDLLEGKRWEYARVWEPTSETGEGPAGYGHMHVALFIEADETEISRGEFEPVMNSYVEAVDAAGSEAHRVDGNAVSVSHSVNNLGSYISEYIGSYGERAVDREMNEQQFYAVTWATNTRRVDFSNGAQELIQDEEFRRETGLRPEDRGGDNDNETAETREGAEWLGEDGREEEEPEWDVRRLCSVHSRSPKYSDPTAGGAMSITVEARRDSLDPPRELN